MELCCIRLARGENLSDEVTVEYRPARIKRERRESCAPQRSLRVHSREREEPVRGLMSELGESLGTSEDTSTAGWKEEGGSEEMSWKKTAAAGSHRVW